MSDPNNFGKSAVITYWPSEPTQPRNLLPSCMLKRRNTVYQNLNLFILRVHFERSQLDPSYFRKWLYTSVAKATFVLSTKVLRFLKTIGTVSWWYQRNTCCMHGILMLSTLRWVPACQDFNHCSGFLHHFVMAELVTSSIWFNSKAFEGESKS